jgi:ABC-type phosphonate transport system ATPase subunit
MISFSNINKQYGKQLLFVDASFQLNPGEKIGLVGPDGEGLGISTISYKSAAKGPPHIRLRHRRMWSRQEGSPVAS